MRRSALFGLLLAGSAVADQWSDQWVADHNAARSKYGLPAVTWDAQAAATAQAWADKCNFAHGGGGGYGQNIWMSSGSGTCNLGDIQGSTSSWMSESKSWTCGKDMWGDGCAGGWSNCGHLTQVLWEKTTAIGCACGATCKLVVCNYNPAGNFVGQQPFPADKCNGAQPTGDPTPTPTTDDPNPTPTTGNPNPRPTDRPTARPTGWGGNGTRHGRPTDRPTERPTGWGGNNTDHHGRPTARPTDHGGRPTDHGGRPTDHGGRPTDHGGRPTDHGGRPTDHGGRPTERPTERPTGWGGNNTDHHGRPTARPTDHGGRPTDRPPWGGGDRPTERPTDRPWGGGGRGGGGWGHGGRPHVKKN